LITGFAICTKGNSKMQIAKQPAVGAAAQLTGAGAKPGLLILEN